MGDNGTLTGPLPFTKPVPSFPSSSSTSESLLSAKTPDPSSSFTLLKMMRGRIERAVRKHEHTTALFWADKAATLSDSLCKQPGHSCTDDALSSHSSLADVFTLAQMYFLTDQYDRAAFLLSSRGFLGGGMRNDRSSTSSSQINGHGNTCCIYLAAKCFVATEKWEEALEVLSVPFATKSDSKTKTEVLNDKQPVAVTLSNFIPLDNVESSIELLRGIVYESLDNRAKATEAYKAALSLDPFCYEALEHLTSHHLLTGKEEHELLNSLHTEGLDKDEVTMLKFLYSSKFKKYEPSVAKLGDTDAVDRLSSNLEIIVGDAERYYYDCEFGKCHEITTQVLDADPYHHACLPLHLACLVELKDINGLFYRAHQLVDSYPERSISWFAVGCYYYLVGNNDYARRYFSKSTTLDGHFGAAWLGFGHSFACEGEHDQAMAAYCTAARLMSGCHLPSLYIGMEYVKTNNRDLAIQYFDQAQSICGNDPLVLHELGVIYYKSSQFEKAEEHFIRALTLCKEKNGGKANPETWEPTLNNLGHVYRKVGNYNKALEYHESALELVPDSASTYAALGYTYHLQGNFDSAIQYYHQALGLNGDDTFCSQQLFTALQEQASRLDI